MRIFVFLHVLTMFTAVALSGGIDILLLRIVATRDVPGIRTAFAAHDRFARFIPAVFGVGLVFGLIAIFAEGFNPFAGWLLLAYPLFALGIAVGGLGIGRWSAKVREVSAAAPDAGSPELTAVLAAPSVRYAVAAFWLIIATIIFVMILKPFA